MCASRTSFEDVHKASSRASWFNQKELMLGRKCWLPLEGWLTRAKNNHSEKVVPDACLSYCGVSFTARWNSANNDTSPGLFKEFHLLTVDTEVLSDGDNTHTHTQQKVFRETWLQNKRKSNGGGMWVLRVMCWPDNSRSTRAHDPSFIGGPVLFFKKEKSVTH